MAYVKSTSNTRVTDKKKKKLIETDAKISKNVLEYYEKNAQIAQPQFWQQVPPLRSLVQGIAGDLYARSHRRRPVAGWSFSLNSRTERVTDVLDSRRLPRVPYPGIADVPAAGVRKEYRKTSVAAAAKGACSRARRGSVSGAALAPIPRRVVRPDGGDGGANSKRNAGATDADATGSPNDNVRAATIERARRCCVTTVRDSCDSPLLPSVRIYSFRARARIFARFAVTDANDFGTRSWDPPPTNAKGDRRPYVKRLARDKTATVQRPRPYSNRDPVRRPRPYDDRDRGHRRRVGDADVPCRAARPTAAAATLPVSRLEGRASKLIQNENNPYRLVDWRVKRSVSDTPT